MKIKIEITKEIIEASKACPFLRTCSEDEVDIIKQNCAFSLAWRDLFPKALVYQRHTFIPEVGVFYHPIEVTKYIQKFDNCDSIEDRLQIPPASFVIEIPEEFIDAIGITEAREIISKSNTLELVDN